MTDNMKSIDLDSASNAQLRFVAETILNLDGIKDGQNNATLLAKIRAVHSAPTIMVPAKVADGEKKQQPAPPIDVAPTPEGATPKGLAGAHFRYDPKVEVMILTTADRTRAQDAFITCNGDTIQVKRGARVQIPYRHYVVLQNAIEQVARDTDQIHPLTGLPIKVFQEQPSYPFQLFKLPSDEEIAAWHARTDNIEMQSPAQIAQAASQLAA